MPPPNFYYRQQPEPPEPEPASPLQGIIPWLLASGCLVFLGASAWAFYHFYWNVRLPQDYMLTDRDGLEIPARLEARSSDIVKFTLLSNGSTRYFPIAQLADKDQEHIRALDMNLSVQFPLYCVLTDKDGHDLQVHVDGRVDNIIKYTLVSDSTSHYIPISGLSAPDQAVMQALPSNIAIHYPLNYQLTDAKGRQTQTRIEIQGHSDTIINYIALADGSTHTDPITGFSPLDQAFFQSLPIQSMPADPTPKPAPDANPLDFPAKIVLADQDGNSMLVELTGRSPELIQYKLVSDDHGYTRYAPISAFSAQNQQFIKKLPANVEPSYPMEIALTDETGQILPVRLNGRSDNFARFVVLTDGISHDYPISKLSALDQVMLRLLPKTFEDPKALRAAPALSNYAKALFDHIVDLDKAIANFNISMATPSASDQERAVTRREIKSDQDEIYFTLLKLAAENGGTNLVDYIQSQLSQLKKQRDDWQSALDAGQLNAADTQATQASVAQTNNEIDVLERELIAIKSPRFVAPGQSAPSNNSRGTTTTRGFIRGDTVGT